MGIYTWLQTISDLIERRLFTVNTYDVGTIVRFDPILQQADVQPETSLRWYDEGGDPVDESQPIICNLPVMFPGNGRVGIDWDIQIGDPCEIHYTKNPIDEWLSTGARNPADDDKRFGMGGATCRVGIHHFAKPRPEYKGHGIAMRSLNPELADTLKVEIDTDAMAVQVASPGQVLVTAGVSIHLDAPRIFVNGKAVEL